MFRTALLKEDRTLSRVLFQNVPSRTFQNGTLALILARPHSLLIIIVVIAQRHRVGAAAVAAAGRSGQDRPGQLQQRGHNSAEAGRRRTSVAVVIAVSATSARRSTQQTAAQRADLGRDELHLGRDHRRHQRLEAGDGLGRFDVVLAVLLDVGLVQLVDEARLGVDQGVDFLCVCGISRQFSETFLGNPFVFCFRVQ